jgi:hypothetical protein
MIGDTTLLYWRYVFDDLILSVLTLMEFDLDVFTWRNVA